MQIVECDGLYHRPTDRGASFHATQTETPPRRAELWHLARQLRVPSPPPPPSAALAAAEPPVVVCGGDDDAFFAAVAADAAKARRHDASSEDAPREDLSSLTAMARRRARRHATKAAVCMRNADSSVTAASHRSHTPRTSDAAETAVKARDDADVSEQLRCSNSLVDPRALAVSVLLFGSPPLDVALLEVSGRTSLAC